MRTREYQAYLDLRKRRGLALTFGEFLRYPKIPAARRQQLHQIDTKDTMITTPEQDWLASVYAAAVKAGHVYPAMAACEAALESSWGKSELCVDARNLFGLKKPLAWTGQTISIATQEFLRGKWVMVPATWPIFTDYAECMAERMNVLKANASYKPALAAKTAEAYIGAVSRVWATDPARGKKVLEIYRAHGTELNRSS